MKNSLSKAVFTAVCLAVMFGVAGCASLQKKFTRKKKVEEAVPNYYRIQDYDIKPSLELYEKHYIYWKTWHGELNAVLGKNSKKDKLCLIEMISNLGNMKNMLTDEKGDQLQKHIDKLEAIRESIEKSALTDGTKTRIRRVLATEYTAIKSGFNYNKVGPLIRDEFRTRYEPRAEEGGPKSGD